LKSLFFQNTPTLKNKRKTIQYGAIYSSLTGSGSAVYGLFDKKTETRGAI